jgi:small subunit ribosomal protein S20
MGTHKSADKRHRQSLKRNERNRKARSTIRAAIKKVDTLVLKGDVKGAQVAAREAVRLLDKAYVHGIVKRNTARRTVSRIDARVAKTARATK